LRLVVNALNDAGYGTGEACDGEVALLVHQREPAPDLIVADLAMPRMDGRMLVEHLQRSKRLAGIPVVLMWARLSADEADMIAWRDARVPHWVMKPFATDALLAKVAETPAAGRDRS
jgi:DNA-binding response OmpR family regulator